MSNAMPDFDPVDAFGFPDSFYGTFVRELPAKAFLPDVHRSMLLREWMGSPEMEPLPDASEYFRKQYGIENTRETALLSQGLLFHLEATLLADQFRKHPVGTEHSGLTKDEQKIADAFADDADDDMQSKLADIAMSRILRASKLKTTLGEIGFGRLKTNAMVLKICDANGALPPEHAAQADYLDETILRLHIEIAYDKTKNANAEIFNDGMKVREKMRSRAWDVLRRNQ